MAISFIWALCLLIVRHEDINIQTAEGTVLPVAHGEVPKSEPLLFPVTYLVLVKFSQSLPKTSTVYDLGRNVFMPNNVPATTKYM